MRNSDSSLTGLNPNNFYRNKPKKQIGKFSNSKTQVEIFRDKKETGQSTSQFLVSWQVDQIRAANQKEMRVLMIDRVLARNQEVDIEKNNFDGNLK